VKKPSNGHSASVDSENEVTDEKAGTWLAIPQSVQRAAGDDNASVAWVETSEPWLWEAQALATLDLPLDLSGNSAHEFHAVLTAARATAEARARSLPIFS